MHRQVAVETAVKISNPRSIDDILAWLDGRPPNQPYSEAASRPSWHFSGSLATVHCVAGPKG